MSNTSFDLINNLSFCVLDLETTGGNLQNDKIIEIGMVRIENLKVVDEKDFLINPEIPIPEFIQKLTGISNSDVENAPTIEQVIHEIIPFLGDSILVAHNTSFDIPFLNSVLRRLGLEELDNKVLCTNVMTKYLIPEIMNSNLNYLSQLFNIDHFKAHRAIEDAKATAELLLKYLDIYISKSIKKINQLYYPKNKFELDRMNFDRNNNFDELKKIIKDIPANKLISYKGTKGTLLAIVPCNNTSEDIDFNEQLFNELDWEMITIKLTGPMLEAIFEFNLHLPKISEELGNQIIDFLNTKVKIQSLENSLQYLNQLDFLITPHLIKEQIVCYNCFSLSTAHKLIFKYPGHRKKFINYACNQIKRLGKKFENKRKYYISKQLIPYVSAYLKENIDNPDSPYINIKANQMLDNQKLVYKEVEKLIKRAPDLYEFPKYHL